MLLVAKLFEGKFFVFSTFPEFGPGLLISTCKTAVKEDQESKVCILSPDSHVICCNSPPLCQYLHFATIISMSKRMIYILLFYHYFWNTFTYIGYCFSGYNFLVHLTIYFY